MGKKVWIGAVVVYITFLLLEFLINGVLLQSVYQETASLWRPEAEMKMWLMFVYMAIMAYFFSLIFSKGYEGKGMMEGIRYGLYMGLMFATPMAYGTYAFMPIPYSLALQWFIYGVVEFIIAGIAVEMVFRGKKAPAPAS